MSVGRFCGSVLVLAGLGLALRDVFTPWLDHNRFDPVSFGAVIAWFRLAALAGAADRLFLRDIYDPVSARLETCWAFAVLIGLGALILLIDSLVTRRGRRR